MENNKNELPQQDIELLVAAGLTIAQAKVYLTLMKLGKEKATNIWKDSQVARQDIYRILSELEAKGLIEKILAKPTQYTALPLPDMFSVLLDNRLQEYEETKRKAKNMVDRYKRAYQPETTEGYHIKILSGKTAVHRFINEKLRLVEKTIDIVDTWGKFRHLIWLYADIYERAANKGIFVRVITDKPEKGLDAPEIVGIIKKKNCCELRHVDFKPKPNVVIQDNKMVLINCSQTRNPDEVTCLISNNPSLVSVIRDYFEVMWTKVAKRNESSSSKIDLRSE